MPCTEPCPALASRLWHAPAAALHRSLGRANSCFPIRTVAPPVTLPSSYPHPQANATFIEDPEMAQRLMDANPNSFRKLVATFLEANGRGYWDASPEQLDRLRQMYM